MKTIEVTDQNAIYVDGTRITNRSTKWGRHRVISCFKGHNVEDALKSAGFEHLLKFIGD